MAGLDRTTLEEIDGWAHVQQSIADILRTPIGTRVMRREYGSALADLIGRPMTPENLLKLYAATAVALALWEPRFALTGVEATSGKEDGRMNLTVRGTYAGNIVTGTIPLETR